VASTRDKARDRFLATTKTACEWGVRGKVKRRVGQRLPDRKTLKTTTQRKDNKRRHPCQHQAAAPSIRTRALIPPQGHPHFPVAAHRRDYRERKWMETLLLPDPPPTSHTDHRVVAGDRKAVLLPHSQMSLSSKTAHSLTLEHQARASVGWKWDAEGAAENMSSET